MVNYEAPGNETDAEDEEREDGILPEPQYDSNGLPVWGSRETAILNRAIDELFPTGKTEAERLAYENETRIVNLKAARRQRLAERLARQAAYMGLNQPE